LTAAQTAMRESGVESGEKRAFSSDFSVPHDCHTCYLLTILGKVSARQGISNIA
jgi:hypothetical protein